MGQLGLLRDRVLEAFDHFESPPSRTESFDDEVLVDDEALAAEDEHVERMRYLRRRQLRQLWSLRKLPPDERASRILGAQRQFRGRGLVELLIEESRATVRKNPRAALEWVDLVPLVLHWTRDKEPPAWAPTLLARALAYRANALRVAGDFVSAERTFIEIHRMLVERPVEDPMIVAEIASLEASLRIGQHRTEQAEDLLERAAVAYRGASDAIGLARTKVKQANLMWDQDRYLDVLRLLEEATAVLRQESDTDDALLKLATVTGRVNALAELGRLAEASRLLNDHLDDFDASDEPFTAAVLHGLRGRIAFGLKDFATAEEAYRLCLEGHLSLGRHHDAALACLDLADTLLAAGKMAELRRLAAELVPLFQRRDLPAEGLMALHHLARAVASNRLSTTLVEQLRCTISPSLASGLRPQE